MTQSHFLGSSLVQSDGISKRRVSGALEILRASWNMVDLGTAEPRQALRVWSF